MWDAAYGHSWNRTNRVRPDLIISILEVVGIQLVREEQVAAGERSGCGL